MYNCDNLSGTRKFYQWMQASINGCQVFAHVFVLPLLFSSLISSSPLSLCLSLLSLSLQFMLTMTLANPLFSLFSLFSLSSLSLFSLSLSLSHIHSEFWHPKPAIARRVEDSVTQASRRPTHHVQCPAWFEEQSRLLLDRESNHVSPHTFSARVGSGKTSNKPSTLNPQPLTLNPGV